LPKDKIYLNKSWLLYLVLTFEMSRRLWVSRVHQFQKGRAFGL